MTNAVQIDEFRVYAWDPKTMMWTLRSKHQSLPLARQEAERLIDTGLRARVFAAKTRYVTVKSSVTNKTREFRLEQQGKMIELADANKRYKSPG